MIQPLRIQFLQGCTFGANDQVLYKKTADNALWQPIDLELAAKNFDFDVELVCSFLAHDADLPAFRARFNEFAAEHADQNAEHDFCFFLPGDYVDVVEDEEIEGGTHLVSVATGSYCTPYKLISLLDRSVSSPHRTSLKPFVDRDIQFSKDVCCHGIGRDRWGRLTLIHPCSNGIGGVDFTFATEPNADELSATILAIQAEHWLRSGESLYRHLRLCLSSDFKPDIYPLVNLLMQLRSSKEPVHPSLVSTAFDAAGLRPKTPLQLCADQRFCA